MESFNREEFIKNYQLTKEEYLVLSSKGRMYYANSLFGYKVNELKNVGDKIYFAYPVNDIFTEYFNECGCIVTKEDLGIEATEVVKVGENNLTLREDIKDILDEHILQIASTKADMIEARINNFFKVKKGRKSRGFKEKYDYDFNQQKIATGLVSSLPAYEQRWLIPVELSNLIDNLNNGNHEYVDLFANEEYLNYLKRNGYEITLEEQKRYLLHK